VYTENRLRNLGERGGGKIDRLVRIGHRVEIGVGRPFLQIHEWIMHRVLPASGKRAVFQNVGHSGVIGGDGPDDVAEELLGILVLHKADFHTGDIMDEQVSLRLVIGKVAHLTQRELGNRIPFFELLVTHTDPAYRFSREEGTTYREKLSFPF
jgi:hypothetical protein